MTFRSHGEAGQVWSLLFRGKACHLKKQMVCFIPFSPWDLPLRVEGPVSEGCTPRFWGTQDTDEIRCPASHTGRAGESSPGCSAWHQPRQTALAAALFIYHCGGCLPQISVKWHQCRGHRRLDWVLERMWNWSWVSFGNRGGGQEGRRLQETSRGSAEAAGGWARTGVRGAKD